VCARRIPANFAAKANEMRTKCDLCFYMEQNVDLVNAAASI
jgi:hypothetical protein